MSDSLKKKALAQRFRREFSTLTPMTIIWIFDLAVRIFSLVTFLWDWIDLMLRGTSKRRTRSYCIQYNMNGYYTTGKKNCFFFLPQRNIRCINIVAKRELFQRTRESVFIRFPYLFGRSFVRCL